MQRPTNIRRRTQRIALILLFLTACSPTNRVADPLPGPEISAEDAEIALVEDKVRERGGYEGTVSVEVKPETSVIALPGLRLYSATPMVVDINDERCAVFGEQVWCFQEALEQIVREFNLGSDPGQLSDDGWLALIAFFTYTTPIAGSDDLGSISEELPWDERFQIIPPSVSRPASGGIEISYFFEVTDTMGFGDLSLKIQDVSLTAENQLTLEQRVIWTNVEE